MNGLFLILPLILIRFALLSVVDKAGLKRAAFFAPLVGREKAAYYFYQISNILFLVYLFFLKITTGTYWFYAGLVMYGLGVLLCLISVINFAKPAKNGINLKGLYRISRNPMYMAYFIYFLGCVLLTRSLLLLVILLLSNGANIKTVGSRLGHTQLSTTNRYVHAVTEADVAAAQTFEDMFSPSKKA